MPTAQEQRDAYRSVIREIAESVEDDGLTVSDCVQPGDLEVIFEEWSACPRNADGWDDALKSGDGAEILRCLTAYAAKLIEDAVEDEALQYASDKSEDAWERFSEDPVDFAADLLRTQLAAMVLK